MDLDRYLGLIDDDEGLTDGLADAESRILLDWLRERVTAAVQAASAPAAAMKQTKQIIDRGRKIAQIAERICYDDEPAEALKIWKSLGHAESFENLASDDPEGVVRQLIAWEESKNAK